MYLKTVSQGLIFAAIIMTTIHAKQVETRASVQAMEVTRNENWLGIIGEYGSKYKLIHNPVASPL
jgi:Zn-dependent M32 family carboxypeptidase